MNFKAKNASSLLSVSTSSAFLKGRSVSPIAPKGEALGGIRRGKVVEWVWSPLVYLSLLNLSHDLKMHLELLIPLIDHEL